MRNTEHYAKIHSMGEKIVSRDQLQIGFIMISKNGMFHKILEILEETPEKFGLPSILEMTYPPNAPQKISFNTATEYYIFSPEENPEYLL